jgi:hypothetical protein
LVVVEQQLELSVELKKTTNIPVFQILQNVHHDLVGKHFDRTGTGISSGCTLAFPARKGNIGKSKRLTLK